MSSFDREQFLKDFNRVNGGTQQTVQQTKGFDRDAFIADFNRVNKVSSTKSGGSKPVSTYTDVERKNKSDDVSKTQLQQENYDRSQEMFSEDEKTRKGNWVDNTIGSFKRGFINSKYASERYDDIMDGTNTADKYKKMLESDEMNFKSTGFGGAVSGVAELLGQQVYQFTAPTATAAGSAGAAMAFAAGQMGPQVVLPEEVVTVPAGYITGASAAAVMENYQIMAASAYDEMVDRGVSQQTAKKVANTVGSLNALLEAAQLDEIISAYKTLNAVGGKTSQKLASKIAKTLTQRGVDVAKETAQEVAQEAVTMAGVDYAAREEGKETYSNDDYKERLKDTAISSALAFGLMNAPAAGADVYRTVRNGTSNKKVTGGASKPQQDAADTNDGNINNINTQPNEAKSVNNEAENTPKREDSIDTLDNNASRASSEKTEAKAAENPALTAENGTKSSEIEGYSAENVQLNEKTPERTALENQVKNIVGIDARTEVEKVAQEQQSKIAMAQEWADKGIAPQEAVEKLKVDAAERVQEAAGRQINLDYQKIDTESGAVREKAIKSGYAKVVERIEKFASKRQLKVKFFEGDRYVSGFEKDGTIYINVTDPKVMYKTAIHETLHGLRSNNQAEYESLKKAIFDAAGKNKKLFMTGVRAEMGYVQSANETVQSSVRNEDGTINRDAVEEEVIAKMCEELIDNPQKFVEKLNGDRTAVQAIIDFVKELIDNVYIEFSNSEKAQMKKAVKEAEKALTRYMKGEAAGKFTVETVNADGEAVPQKPVTMNFPAEFGEILGAELKKQADLNAELSVKDEQVFGKIVDAIKKDGVKFSVDSDGDVISLSERVNKDNKDIRYSLFIDDKGGVRDYNIKWATDNNIITDNDLANLRDKLQNKAGYHKLTDGKIVAVGEEFGINNKLLFFKDYSSFTDLEKIVVIWSDDETIIDPIRRVIYEGASINSNKIQNVRNVFGDVFIGEYRNKDIKHFQRDRKRYEKSRRTRSQSNQNFGDQQNRGRNSAESTGIVKKSINTDDVKIPARYEGKSLSEILDMLIDEHGAIEQGENPAREIEVPKKDVKGNVVSKFARTVAEAEATPDDFAQNNLLDMTAKGQLSHEVVTDKMALRRAESILRNKGWEDSLAEWNAAIRGRHTPNKYDIALGQMLYNNAVNSGDIELAQKLVCDLCVQATRAGQTVQAFRLLKKLTPEGRLYMLQKSVDQINREQLERYKADYKDIKIPKELAKKLIKSKDNATADAAVEEIEQYIADQIPSTIADKFNAWRYLAMLGNPRTHFRNWAGNIMFSPFKFGKDIIGARIEKKFLKDGVRTKARTSKKTDPDLWAYAEKDFKKNESAIKGEAKYSIKSGIKEKQKVFENKYLEKARKFNTEQLEKTDLKAIEKHYISSLAGAMKANGITAKTAHSAENEKVMAAIKTYATNEAQKATYRDVNAFSKAVQDVKKTLNKNPVSSVFIEGILPFARTPANVIARGVEYSPVGIVRGGVNLATGGIDFTSAETVIASVKQALKGVKSGKYTTAEALDQLSAGLTGTAICILGGILASLGWVKGKEDDGGKEGNFEKLYGMQDYALMIGGTSYTIDWAAPAAMPFFVGVELYNAFSDTENSSGIVSALLKITDPVFEMSMLDGINNAIEATAYTDTHPIIAMGTSSVLNYAGQAVPTLAGQFARTANRYRTQTYIDKNKDMSPTMQRFVQQQQAKIPGLNNQLTSYYDQWGRKQDNGNVGARAFTNFASPGYISTDKSTPVDDEIKRIYDELGDAAVLPDYAAKKFNVNGETKHLTGKEYETFAETRGQTAYNVIEQIMNNPAYKVLDTDEQAAAITKAYSYANAKAKAEVSDYELTKQEKAMDKNPAQYVLGYGAATQLKNKADDKGNKNGSMSQDEAVAYLNSRSFTRAQKAILFECMCTTAKTNPYK